MFFGKGIPIISASLSDSEGNRKLYHIGDIISGIKLRGQDTEWSGALVGIELQPIKIMGDDSFYSSYDNVPTDGYENPTCAMVPNIDHSHDIYQIVIRTEDDVYVPIRLEEITAISLSGGGEDSWVDITKEAFLEYLNSLADVPAVVSINVSDSGEIDVIINDVLDPDEINLVSQLISMEGMSKVTFTSGDTSATLIVGSTETYDPFRQALIDVLPVQNNEIMKGELVMSDATGTSLVYTLKVTYYNEGEVVAKIGDAPYSSLQNAFAAVQAGETVLLMKDITVDNAEVASVATNGIFNIPAGVTFDGQDHVITANAETWVGETAQNHVFTATSGNATIKNVTIEGHAKAKSGVCAYGAGTNVTIERVTCNNFGNVGFQIAGAIVSMTEVATSGNAWGGINVDKAQTTGVMPSLTFNSGTLVEDVELYTELVDDSVITAPSMSVYIGYGEKLKGFKFYTTDVKRLGVATAVVGGKNVVYETASDMSIVTDGTVVTLLDDVTEDVVIDAGANVVIDLGGHKLTNVSGDTIVNNGNLTIQGTGTVDNVTHGKAAVLNNGTCVLNGGVYERSAEAGTASGNGGNSYYTILNHGEMEINAGVEVKNSGAWSSNVSNGWYDSTGKSEDDVCKLTVNGAVITGGKYTIKGDELGETIVNDGTFSGTGDVTMLNWHKMTVNGGTFTNDSHASISNGTYGLGVGELTVTDGVFDNPGMAFSKIADYPSDKIVITGGTYNIETAVDASYIPDTHQMELQADGKYKVVAKTPAEMAEAEVDEIIANLPDLDITPDPEVDNQFSIVTSDGSLSNSGLFESLAAVDGVTSIQVTNGSATATFTAGGDMAAFKAEVDAMLPTKVDDPEVTLTMTVLF